MKPEILVRLGTFFATSGVLFGGLSAFSALATSIQPGRELGISAAVLGIVIGVVCSGIGIGSRVFARSRRRPGKRVGA